jgi:hypothetical protein
MTIGWQAGSTAMVWQSPKNKQFSMQLLFYDVSRDITGTSDSGMNVAYYMWGTQPSSHNEVIF